VVSFVTDFAVLSHILPPSPSGQAVVLCRLLKDLPPERYCLISLGSNTDERQEAATVRLPGAYHRLRPGCQLPTIDILNVGAIIAPLNAACEISRRAKQIEEVLVGERCRLVVACSGDLYDLPAAHRACAGLGLELIPYIFDDYLWQWTGHSRSVARRMEPAAMKYARCVIVPNEFLAEEYRRRYGVSCVVVHNPAVMHDPDELDGSACGSVGGINIVYTGAVYHAHFDAFRNLIAAVESLGRKDLKLHIYTAQPESELRQKGIAGSAVVYHQHIPHDEVHAVLRNADILFLPLAFRSPIPEVIRTSSPGKMAEYFFAGRPVFVHAPADSYVSWYCRLNKCGEVADKEDPAILAEALLRLISDAGLRKEYGRNALTAAERDFSIPEARRAFHEALGIRE